MIRSPPRKANQNRLVCPRIKRDRTIRNHQWQLLQTKNRRVFQKIQSNQSNHNHLLVMLKIHQLNRRSKVRIHLRAMYRISRNLKPISRISRSLWLQQQPRMRTNLQRRKRFCSKTKISRQSRLITCMMSHSLCQFKATRTKTIRTCLSGLLTKTSNRKLKFKIQSYRRLKKRDSHLLLKIKVRN